VPHRSAKPCEVVLNMDYEMMMRERESDFMLDAREQMIELHTSLFMILVFTLKNFSVSLLLQATVGSNHDDTGEYSTSECATHLSLYPNLL